MTVSDGLGRRSCECPPSINIVVVGGKGFLRPTVGACMVCEAASIFVVYLFSSKLYVEIYPIQSSQDCSVVNDQVEAWFVRVNLETRKTFMPKAHSGSNPKMHTSNLSDNRVSIESCETRIARQTSRRLPHETLAGLYFLLHPKIVCKRHSVFEAVRHDFLSAKDKNHLL